MITEKRLGDAEVKIDELQREVEMMTEQAATFRDLCIDKAQLIYKLACELRAYHQNYNLISPKIDALLKNAWEATKEMNDER